MSTAPTTDERRDPLALDPLSPTRGLGFVVDWQLTPPASPAPKQPPASGSKKSG